jgi:hypothetical protein
VGNEVGALAADLRAARASSDSGTARRIGQLLDDVLVARSTAFERERASGVPLDPFELFGRHHHELTHSATLRWLLDARGTHGFGDAFARAFLEGLGRELPEGRSTTALEVRGQESVIDIVVEWDSLIVGIENKVFSSEGEDQTGREWRDLNRLAGGRDAILVYLTPTGRVPTEPHATPLAWPVIGDLIGRIAPSAHASTRVWLDGIRFHIERLFGRGGNPMGMVFREDVKVLLGRWRDYREILDTAARAEQDLSGILQAAALELLRKPWAGAGWEHHAEGCVYLRRQSWGDGKDRVRLCVADIAFENMLGRSKDPWWSGVQVVGTNLDQARLCAMLREHTRGGEKAATWTFQPTSSDGAVMYRYLEPLTAQALAEGAITEVIEREFELLAKLISVVDAFMASREGGG